MYVSLIDEVMPDDCLSIHTHMLTYLHRYAGSKIRLNGPRFLAYAIVDSIVDEIFPILRLLRKKVCMYVCMCVRVRRLAACSQSPWLMA